MRTRKMKALIGIMAALSVTACSFASFAEDDSDDAALAAEEAVADSEQEDAEATEEEAYEESEADAADEQDAQAVQEQDVAEEETEEETEESDFIEGSALLSDYDYEQGEITDEGWESEYLNMTYVPDEDAGITMGVDENEQLKEYHERNGEDKQVSANEMVALNENDGYVQLMVEVNPNNESAEAMLDRFTENEDLELISVAKDMDIGERVFYCRTGVNNSEKFMIGVCTEEDGIVMAVKVKYENTTARKELLAGFAALELEEEETEEESETETEAEDGYKGDVATQAYGVIVADDETEEDSEEDEYELLVIDAD